MANTKTYQVLYDNSPVKSKASLFSKPIGMLNKDDIIEVSKINNWWATFNYKKKKAYISTIFIKRIETNLPEIKGSITVKYIDKSTKQDIYPSELFDNLELKKYTYTAKILEGYSITEENTKSVILTSDNPIQTITFVYSKIILGQITIN